MEKPFAPRLTVGLDVARALAATCVVLHHLAQSRGWTNGGGGGYCSGSGRKP